MINNERKLNVLERAVLEKLLDGNHPVLAALRVQLGSCEVSRREFTGCGFFTNLEVERSIQAAPTTHARAKVLHVGARISGLMRGASFVLFVTDGYMDLLEGFSYDESWPEVISGFSLYYEGSRVQDPAAVNL